MEINIRKSTKEDLLLIYDLVKEFALFLGKEDKVKVSIKELEENSAIYQCLIVEDQANNIVGYALYFYSFHTWSGKAVYIDDLFIRQPYRHKGFGAKLINAVFEEARKANCKNVKWEVLNWNKDAIAFYIKLGALLDDENLNCTYKL